MRVIDWPVWKRMLFSIHPEEADSKTKYIQETVDRWKKDKHPILPVKISTYGNQIMKVSIQIPETEDTAQYRILPMNPGYVAIQIERTKSMVWISLFVNSEPSNINEVYNLLATELGIVCINWDEKHPVFERIQNGEIIKADHVVSDWDAADRSNLL